MRAELLALVHALAATDYGEAARLRQAYRTTIAPIVRVVEMCE